MFRILVVDDEKWIRKGIQAIIDKRKFDIYEITEAENAVEAEDAFKGESPPDILICDVKMPVKDGCTFCEEVMLKYTSTKIIMVSGYNEFSYVQRALKYKAADYLLKPIDKHELNKAIEKCVDELKNEKRITNLVNNGTASLEKLLEQKVHHPLAVTKDQIEKLLDIYIGAYKDYFVISIEYNTEEYEETHFKSVVQDVFGSYSEEILRTIIFDVKDNHINLIIFRKTDVADNNNLVRRIVMELQSRNILQFCLSSSGLNVDINNLPLAYNGAMNHLEERKVYDSFYCNIPSGTLKSLSDKYLLIAKDIISCIEQQNVKRLDDLIYEIEKLFKAEKEMPIKTIKVFFNSLIYDCIRMLMKRNNFENWLIEEGIQKSNLVMSSYNIDQIIRAVSEFALKVSQNNEKKSQKEVCKIVDEVISYIKQNYREEIGLNNIATKFYVNSSYFSFMFKEITGETFINYLTNIRMNEAKRLIKQTNLKINEIADQVGYTDGRYFCKVFKKTTGMVPTEYKTGCVKNATEI